MLLAGMLFVLTRNYLLLLVAATVGVISPSGNEVGPFLPIEQAAFDKQLVNGFWGTRGVGHGRKLCGAVMRQLLRVIH